MSGRDATAFNHHSVNYVSGGRRRPVITLTVSIQKRENYLQAIKDMYVQICKLEEDDWIGLEACARDIRRN